MPDKSYKVIISDKAMSMLTNHVRFLAQVSVKAANKLKSDLIKEMGELSYMPEGYPWLISEFIPANKYRKKPVCKRYLLIYQIVGDTVYIHLKTNKMELKKIG